MGRGYHQFLEEHWEMMTGEAPSSSRLRPLFTIDREDEDEVLGWCEDTLEAMEDQSMLRAANMVNNIRFYNAIQSLSQKNTQGLVDRDGRSFSRPTRVILNHVRDFVRQSAGRLTRFKPQVNTIPWSSEYGDRIGAMYGKRIVDNAWYVNNMQGTFWDVALEMKICGESFLFQEFDPYAGDKDLNTEKVAEFEKMVREKVKDEEGREIQMDMVKRVGDVCYDHPLPWFVIHEPCFRWTGVNWIFRGQIKHMDEIIQENMGMPLGKMKPVGEELVRKGMLGDSFGTGEWCVEWTMYHKRHRFIDGGFFCRFVDGALLDMGPNPAPDAVLPVSRITDLDDPLDAHGISFLEDLKLPQVLFNNMMTLMYRNVAIAAQPKILLPEGSADPYTLANGPMVVPFQWPMKPEIAVFNTVGGEVFALADNVMNQMQQLSHTFGTSRGETVANARAKSILAFYEEQEEKSENPTAQKWTAFTENVAKQTLGLAGKYYEPDDGRVTRIVGKRNQYKVRRLDSETKLSGAADVIVERNTSLSESKQSRIDQIHTLSTAPLATPDGGKPESGLFTREEILQMLNMADTEAFYEFSTAAVDKADSENEDMFEGIEVPAPSTFEAHMVHWNRHFLYMQSREFTETKHIPDEVRALFLEHMRTTEMLMWEQAKRSLTFAQTLLDNPYFPTVFVDKRGPTLAQIVQQMTQPPPELPPEIMQLPEQVGIMGQMVEKLATIHEEAGDFEDEEGAEEAAPEEAEEAQAEGEELEEGEAAEEGVEEGPTIKRKVIRFDDGTGPREVQLEVLEETVQ